MNILKNISLKPYNSFGIDVIAETFVEITSEADFKTSPLKLFPKCFVLGGGSNIVAYQRHSNTRTSYSKQRNFYHKRR
ncbi:hypothetical protein CCAN12_690012 [Capnocytophaga canimorsus]|uniref:UDP-N-acetylenolpyruvoylglucosamine reductase n=1 Tax=Capnocytophaga canimorsus TaxID=28188 RepID=A0A0B7HH06_9FLAO|nr:hypothetical protein CCAN12_690012 [Capnocytophaga canimorsus]